MIGLQSLKHLERGVLHTSSLSDLGNLPPDVKLVVPEGQSLFKHQETLGAGSIQREKGSNCLPSSTSVLQYQTMRACDLPGCVEDAGLLALHHDPVQGVPSAAVVQEEDVSDHGWLDGLCRSSSDSVETVSFTSAFAELSRKKVVRTRKRP